MKIYFYLYILLFQFLQLTAQSSFRNFYSRQNPSGPNIIDDRVIQTADSGFVEFSHQEDGSIRVFSLTKTDALGNITWSYQYHLAQNWNYQYATSFAVFPDQSFGVLQARDSARIYYWHISAQGQILSIKGFKADSTNSIFAGSFTDAAGNNPDLTVGTDGNLLLGAGVSTTISGSNSGVWNWLLKTDPSGNPIWSTFFRRDSLHKNPSFRRVTSGLNGSYFGYSSFGVVDSMSNIVIFTDVYKVDALGNVQWYKQIGVDYQTVKFACTSTGHLLLLGNGPQNIFVMKLDSLGTVMWTKRSVVYDSPGSIAEMPNGNYLLARNGNTPSVIMLDTSGTPVGSVKRIQSNLFYPWLLSVIPTFDNTFVAAGGGDSLSGFALIKSDDQLSTACGDLLSGFVLLDTIIIDSSGFVQLNVNVDVIDVTAGSYTTPNTFIKLDECDPTSIEENQNDVFDFYPNPASSFVEIRNNSFLKEKINIEIFNLTGKLILSENHPAQNSSINVSFDLMPGFYFIRISDGFHTSAKKLIVK